MRDKQNNTQELEKKLCVSGHTNGEMVTIFNKYIEVPNDFEVTQVEEFVGKQGEEIFNKVYYVGTKIPTN